MSEIIAAPSPAPTLTSGEVNVIVTPVQATAGTAPFAATAATDVALASVFATNAPPASEAVVTSVEQDVDALRFALGTPPAPATEPLVVPSATPEPNPATEASRILSEEAQEAPQPAGPEQDPAIAKVA